MSERGSSQLCVTVSAPTMAELRLQRDAVRHADLIELRLDTVRDIDVAAALSGRTAPVIVTCRSAQEGGGFQGSEEERKRVLTEAFDRGAEFVDIEASAGFADLVAREHGRRVVLSMHDFRGMPADLIERVRDMRRTGAAVIKAAVTPSTLSDCIPLLEVSRELSGVPHVLIAMGDPGLVTRVLPSRFGSCWTYAGERIAPGQVTASTLLERFHYARIGPDTTLYGIVGKPVMHSMSPVMHNAGFEATGRDAVYLPLAAADVDDFLRFAEAFGVQGASITIPFKVDMFDRVGAADAVTRTVGAVNTVRREGDRWVGLNTDVAGFLEPLGGAFGQETRALVLGAGGAARAVAVALRSIGVEVTISARDLSKARSLAALVGGSATAFPPPRGVWDLIVNTTPVGMSPHVEQTPLSADWFNHATIYDVVYHPQETRLLREGRAAGCQTIGGLDMLVAQAELQFEWWTGERPPSGLFRDAATRGLREAEASPPVQAVAT
jgi:3-dehydroquinate dehydratase/shikimate dehydrogenase